MRAVEGVGVPSENGKKSYAKALAMPIDQAKFIEDLFEDRLGIA